MVAIDTDVFVLAFAFHHDARQSENSRFLSFVRTQTPVITIYSVMELLGQLSFNLSHQRLTQWQIWLQDYYQLTLVYPETADLAAATFFQSEFVERPLERMQHRLPFLDSLILGLLEQVPDIETFVTWNARHFRDKSRLNVLTPAEYLAFASQGTASEN